MTGSFTALAPAKVNLCLFVGPTRADGRHELVSVFDSLDLADELRLAPADRDEVVCPGVQGDNLAAAALAAFRAATGWRQPVRLTIAKRIPIAGGMAGGSADAAAALRLAAAASGLGDDGLLHELATGLGADVPSQIHGGRMLGTGAGEELLPLGGPAEAYGALVLPVDAQLGAGEVYAEADRLGLARDADGLAAARARIQEAGEGLFAAGLVHNDLQDAARSLCPAIDDALATARDAGADHALVSGSGPTVLGLFTGPHGIARAHAAAGALGARRPAPLAARPLPAGAGTPRPEAPR